MVHPDVNPRGSALQRGTPSGGCRSLVAKVWHRAEMSESFDVWASQQKCSVPISTPSFARQSATLFVSRFTWEGVMLRLVRRRLPKSSSSPESHQLGEIFEGLPPWRILVIN
jgi:hypothetical protein